jgi:glutamate racemase
VEGRPAIGVFDSGFGGLHILQALIDLMPDERFVYLGDSRRSPYGDRPAAEVADFARQIVHYLLARYPLAMIVVACNTVSAVALENLARIAAPVPVVGVIEAGVRAIRQTTTRGRVGVVGTTATIRSGVYQRALTDLTVQAAAVPGLVEFVEAGEIDSPLVGSLLRRVLAPVRAAEVDTVLLACTHYPYLAGRFKEVLGEDVLLISTAEETAFQVKRELRGTLGRSGPGEVELLCTGEPEEFVRIGSRLFGRPLGQVRRVTLADWRHDDDRAVS